jgi:carbon starvation protein CstA
MIIYYAISIGDIFYGKFVESIFKPDANRAPAALTHADGVGSHGQQ